MKRVVFVADDLGLTRGTNRGIERAVENGIVREVSVMATGPALDDAAERARSLGAGIGLHLCFTLGSALTGPIRGLTDSGGGFLSMPLVLASCCARVPDRARVEEEVEAQLDALASRGVEVGHLDGHHHVHVFPVVRDAVIAVARARGIAQLRIPFERARPSLRMGVLGQLARGFERRLRRELPGLAPLPVVGLGLSGVAHHAREFRKLAEGVPSRAEWVVHPREVDDELERVDPGHYGARRATEEELATLADPATRELLKELGIEPCRFTELASDGANGARSGGD